MANAQAANPYEGLRTLALQMKLADPALLDEERLATMQEQLKLRAEKKLPLRPLHE